LFTIAMAQPEEREAAFGLVFQYLDEEERGIRVANALLLVSTGELDPAGILVVREGVQLHGALVCLPLRGAGGLLWPPHVQAGPQHLSMENQLLQAGLSWLRSKGAKLVQALLRADETPLAGPMMRNGFNHVTRLHYLRHDLQGPASISPNLAAQTYSPANRSLFHDVLLRTYEGTLDCPELNGLRTIEEIIDGHQAQGEFRPERWWLVSDGPKPVGVVLATAIAEGQSWDLSYVGVVPEARGRAWGRKLTQLAIGAARTAGVGQITVAVDTRNRPAWNLYVALGFEPTGEREVFLNFFRA